MTDPASPARPDAGDDALVDRAGRIVSLPPGCAEELGVDPADTVDRLFTTLLHPDDTPAVALLIGGAGAGGRQAVRLQSPTGWTWWTLRFTATPGALLRIDCEPVAEPTDALALRQALGTAVGALGTGVAVLHCDGTILAANTAAAAIAGRPAGELIGTRMRDLDVYDGAGAAVPADQRPSDQVCRDGVQVDGLFQLRRGDGSLAWVASTWHPAAGGQAVGTLRDVTAEQVMLRELATARDEVTARERRMVSLISNSAGHTFLLDTGARFTWVSDSVRRAGMDPAALLGSSVFTGLHPQDHPTGRLILEQALHHPGEPVQRHRLRWADADGGWTFVDVAVTNLLDDPAVGGLVLNVRDVSEQVRTEVALRQQDEMFRALLTHSHDELWVFDADGMARYASPSAEERVGRPYRVGDAAHPDDRARKVAAFQHVATTPSAEVELDYRVLGPNGAITWMDARLVNLLHDPAVRGVVVTARDVSARHRERILSDGQQRALELASAEAPLSEVLGELCATVERYLEVSAGTSASMTLLASDGRYEGPYEPVVVGYGTGGATLADRAGYHAEKAPPVLTGRFAGPIADSPMLGPVAARATAGGLRWMWRTPVGGERVEPLGTLVVAVAADRGPQQHEQEMLDRIADLMWALATRDRARKSVTHSEMRFRAAFADTGVPTAWLSLDGRFEEVNGAMTALFGHSAEQLLGAHFDTLLTDAGTPGPCRLDGTVTPQPTELTMCRADGTPLQVVCHTTVIRNADGLPAQMVVHYIDVTALRQGEEDVRILNEELCVRIAELDQAKDRLAAAYLQVTAARESERRQLSVDLHDRPVQALLACLWSLDFLELEEDDEDLVKLREQLTGAIEETRQMIFELRPPALDMQGLPAAVDAELERLRTDTGVTTSLESDLDDRAPAEIETMVFRTLREALLNVRKHAKADTVVVRLAMREDMLWAQVVDDGVGFDPVKAAQRAAEGHYGVTSIRETLALAGGAVYVGPRRDGCRGTEVELTLPLVASAGWWGAVPEAALA